MYLIPNVILYKLINIILAGQASVSFRVVDA